MMQAKKENAINAIYERMDSMVNTGLNGWKQKLSQSKRNKSPSEGWPRKGGDGDERHSVRNRRIQEQMS
jgi:hypothetical protein